MDINTWAYLLKRSLFFKFKSCLKYLTKRLTFKSIYQGGVINR